MYAISICRNQYSTGGNLISSCLLAFYLSNICAATTLIKTPSTSEDNITQLRIRSTTEDTYIDGYLTKYKNRNSYNIWLMPLTTREDNASITLSRITSYVDPNKLPSDPPGVIGITHTI